MGNCWAKSVIRIVLLGVSLFFLTTLSSFPLCANVPLETISGSDLIVGTGARAISMGGAFTAIANDGTAIFWNPAGVANSTENMITVIGDSSRPSLDFASLTYHFQTPYNLSLSLAYNTRLQFRGLGDWGNSERARDLLDLAMLTYYMDFSQPEWQGIGGVDSNTIDYRVGLAGEIRPNLLLGFSYVNYRCSTTFYGAWQNNVCVILRGQNVDAGLLYKANETFHLGLSALNLFRDSQVPLPYYLSAGLWKQWHENWSFSSDLEHVFGNNGKRSNLNFWVARFGGEYLFRQKHRVRAGLICPLVMESSQVTNLKDKLYLPVMPSVGYGYNYKRLTIDTMLSPNVGYTYVENVIQPDFKLALTYAF